VTLSSLTPQEFELHLKDLRQRLRAYLERGEGSLRGLRKEAEDVLALAPQFPQVYERYPDVEGMVAEMLARQRQEDIFGTGKPRQAPGCMLAWLLHRKQR
jgi:hypothetical protein